MTRFALTIEYDGRPFMGWQRQAHGPSVQQTIEEAIHRFTAENAQVFSAGRTDAGVHAIAMRAHVDIEKPLSPFKLTEALNAQLRPAPIARSEEHTSELQSLMRISSAVFCLKK